MNRKLLERLFRAQCYDGEPAGGGGAPAEAPAAPAPSAPTESAPAPDSSPAPSAVEAMRFDPFDMFTKTDLPETVTPAAPTAPQQPAPTPAAEAQPAPQALAAPDVLSRLDAIQAQLAQPQTQPQTPTPPDPYTTVPEYAFQIPDAVFQGLESEDPGVRRQATAVLAQGVARTVHASMMQTIKPLMVAMQENFPRLIQSHMINAEQQRTIQADFYGRHKDLDIPALKPVIAQIGVELAQKERVQQYTPEFGDRIALFVRQMVFKQQGAQPTVPQPPQQFGGGARPAQPSNPNDQSKDIADILFG